MRQFHNGKWDGESVFVFGSNLAGYKHEDIAPMFKHAPDNCILPIEWKAFVE